MGVLGAAKKGFQKLEDIIDKKETVQTIGGAAVGAIKSRRGKKSLDTSIDDIVQKYKKAKELPDTDKYEFDNYLTSKGIDPNKYKEGGLFKQIAKRYVLAREYVKDNGGDIKPEMALDFLEILLYGLHPESVEFKANNPVTNVLTSLYVAAFTVLSYVDDVARIII